VNYFEAEAALPRIEWSMARDHRWCIVQLERPKMAIGGITPIQKLAMAA
jgi:hypothetical protein